MLLTANLSTARIGVTLCAFAASFICSTALAAKKAPSMAASNSSSSGKASDRDFLVSFPIVAERPQLRLHLEFNAWNEAGIALEGGLIGETEELDAKEIDETGNSLKIKGAQASLLISRYSEPTRLGGFFWTLGGGYRQFSAEWKTRPETGSNEPALASPDSEGYLHHRVVGSGVMGQARVGYRYVAAEWPVAIGAHIGMRHTNTTVKDVDVEDEEEQELKLQYSPTNDREKKNLKHRMMTQPDFTIDFGVIF